LIHCQCKTF